MAAGLGFKDFVTGEVLTAADVDGYLMQGIWVFANATARDAAVTSPQEGNFAFLKDTNTTTYYTGSAWTNLDTTGMVNPMTTTGDTIYSSSGSTPARLGIGTAGQILQVNSGATAPEWATPAAGGGANWSLLNSGGTALTGAATITVSGISGKDKILVIVENASSLGSTTVSVRLNADTGSNYYRYGMQVNAPVSYGSQTIRSMIASVGTSMELGITHPTNFDYAASGYVLLSGCNSAGVKVFNLAGTGEQSASTNSGFVLGGYYNSATVISSISVFSSNNNFDAGTVYVYTSA
jgi:hypothetical protein